MTTPGRLHSEKQIVVDGEGSEYHAYQLSHDNSPVMLFDMYRHEDKRFEHNRVKIRTSKKMSGTIARLFSGGDLYLDE